MLPHLSAYTEPPPSQPRTPAFVGAQGELRAGAAFFLSHALDLTIHQWRGPCENDAGFFSGQYAATFTCNNGRGLPDRDRLHLTKTTDHTTAGGYHFRIDFNRQLCKKLLLCPRCLRSSGEGPFDADCTCLPPRTVSTKRNREEERAARQLRLKALQARTN